jgi:hypothetical protein
MCWPAPSNIGNCNIGDEPYQAFEVERLQLAFSGVGALISLPLLAVNRETVQPLQFEVNDRPISEPHNTFLHVQRRNKIMDKVEMSHTETPSNRADDKEEFSIDQSIEESKPFLDLENQEGQKQEALPIPTEPAPSSLKTFLYLATYFVINLSLTFYNKAVMGSVRTVPG